METLAGEQWLYNTLTGSTALMAQVTGVYSYLAPQATATPYIIYGLQSGVFDQNVNGQHPCLDALYQVKVVHNGTAGFMAAGSIFGTVRTLLEGVRGTVTGYAIVGCMREQPLQFQETYEGVNYLHVGAFYRLYAAGTV